MMILAPNFPFGWDTGYVSWRVSLFVFPLKKKLKHVNVDTDSRIFGVNLILGKRMIPLAGWDPPG